MVFSRSFCYLLLLVFAFFSSSARASPYPSMGSPTSILKLAARVNSSGMKNIIAADRARARAFQKRDISDTSIGLANAQVVYTASIGVGSPPTFYTLLADTGSANTWIGANNAYVPTGTSQDTSQTFKVTYGSGQVVEGKEYLDKITVKDNLVVDGAYIGVASAAALPNQIDGILGLGPARLSEGEVTGFGVIPTVVDGLFAQNQITSAQLGVFFPPASTPDNTGELSFGGYDASKVVGALNEVEITSVSPASQYWGVEQVIYYGDHMILNSAAGIIDTGTTLILIPTNAFNDYKARTGAVYDPFTSLLTITLEQYDNLSPVFFNIGGVSYEFSPNAQIWPRALNTAMGGDSDTIYLIISDIGSVPDTGALAFINGYCFIQRFYVGINFATSKIGLGKTSFTFATTN